jgi:RNA polymerase sigma-70 factor (ECF subfamily)
MATSTNHADQLLTHAEFLRRIAVHLAGHDADDLQQATWAAATQHPPTRAGNERGWLATIANNLWRNERRGRSRRSHHEAQRPPRGPVPTPVDIAAREEVRRRVVAAVMELPEPLREVVVLRYYEGLESAAIGRRLGLAPSTVRTRLQQSIGQLRVRLDEEHGGSRAAWATPLLGWLRASPPLPSMPVAHRAAWSMAGLAATALLALGIWTWWPVDVRPATGPRVGTVEAAATPVAGAAVPTARREAPSVVPPSSTAPPNAPAWQPPLGMLRGVVVRSDTGEPVPAARVAARRSQRPTTSFAPFAASPTAERQTLTGDDGSFVLADLPAGNYDLDAQGPDTLHAWVPVALAETPRDLRIVLEAKPARGDVQVRVLDTSNRGAAAAVTLALGSQRAGHFGWDLRPPLQGSSGEDGWYGLRDRPELDPIERGTVLARTADGRVGIATLKPSAGPAPASSTVVVDAPATIVGRLTGLTSYRGVGILAHPGETIVFGAECFAVPGEVADDGSFRITGLPASDYRLQVTGLARRADREQFWNCPKTTVTAGAVVTSDPATIPCLAGARLRGLVRDADGRAIDGARITAVRPWINDLTRHLMHHPERQAARWFHRVRGTTDANGRYELRLEPGAWQIVVVAPGHAMDVRLRLPIGDEPSVELEHTLAAAGALAGHTHNGVLLRHTLQPEVRHSVTNGGVFELGGLRPGRWELGCDDDGAFTVAATAEVVAGRTTWVDLARGEERVHRGMLLHAGEPLADHEVRIEGGAPVRTAADGSFTLHHTHIPGDEPDLLVDYRGLHVTRTDQLDGVVELPGRWLEIETVRADGTRVPARIRIGNTWDGNGRKYDVHDHYGRSDRRGGLDLPDGHLRFLACDTDDITSVVATFADGSRTRVRVGDASRVRLVHRPAGAVALRAMDAAGHPVAGQRGTALPWGHAHAAPADAATFAAGCADEDEVVVAETDAAGAALLRGVLPGPTLVTVWHAGARSSTTRIVDVAVATTTACELVLAP